MDIQDLLKGKRPGVSSIEDSEFETDFASLYIRPKTFSAEIPDEYQRLAASKALPATLQSANDYKLYIGEFSHEGSELNIFIEKLREGTEDDDLYVEIASVGGGIHEGRRLINVIKEHFYGRTTTILNPYGYSMGAVLFSIGDKRVVYENSEIMYHNYSTAAYGKGDEVVADILFADRSIHHFFKPILVNSGFLTEEEYERMKDGHDFWFDSEEMAKRGIATHVIVSGYELEASEYIEYLVSGMSIDGFITSSEQKTAKEEALQIDAAVEQLLAMKEAILNGEE